MDEHMNQELSLKVKTKYVNKVKSDYPLIAKEAISNPNALEAEGMIVRLVDEQNRFLGKGYYGNQNKGLGWLLSRDEQEQFDYPFFKQKIESATMTTDMDLVRQSRVRSSKT